MYARGEQERREIAKVSRRLCGQCGYDVTDAKVREGGRLCTECGVVGLGVRRVLTFREGVKRAVWWPLRGAAWAAAFSAMIGVIRMGRGWSGWSLGDVLVATFFGAWLVMAPAVTVLAAWTVGYAPVVWGRMHPVSSRASERWKFRLALMAVLFVAVAGVYALQAAVGWPRSSRR